MEELRRKLIDLIEIKGISSKETIKASEELDKLIVEYHKEDMTIKKEQKVVE
jgi:hypothetical protein